MKEVDFVRVQFVVRGLILNFCVTTLTFVPDPESLWPFSGYTVLLLRRERRKHWGISMSKSTSTQATVRWSLQTCVSNFVWDHGNVIITSLWWSLLMFLSTMLGGALRWTGDGVGAGRATAANGVVYFVSTISRLGYTVADVAHDRKACGL